jgi:uncharacterized membrane protein
MPLSRVPRWHSRLVWSGALLLVAIGVAAGVARAIHVSDLGARLEPARSATFRALGVLDPSAERRLAEVRAFDERYARHRAPALMHVLPGALFLLLAPLQLSARVRSRRPRLHRWTGRLAVVAGIVSAAAGLHFGLAMPHAGVAEAVPIAIFALLFLSALLNGVAAIRAGDRVRHREWMIRAFGLAAGISMVRLVALPLDVALTPAGYTPSSIFVISIWLGWLLALGGAELWLSHTRAPMEVATPRRSTSAALPDARTSSR